VPLVFYHDGDTAFAILFWWFVVMVFCFLGSGARRFRCAMIPTLAVTQATGFKGLCCWLNLVILVRQSGRQTVCHCLGLLMVCPWTGGVWYCVFVVFVFWVSLLVAY